MSSESKPEPKQKKIHLLVPLIQVPVPEAILDECDRRGKFYRDLATRYRNTAPGSQAQVACANHLANVFDDKLWDLYYRERGFPMKRADAWLRAIDYAVEKGIHPGTVYNAARAGKIPDAHERDNGVWYVSDKCDFMPRVYGDGPKKRSVNGRKPREKKN
jgi:hypothetical protein